MSVKVLQVDFNEFKDGWVTTLTAIPLDVREQVVARDGDGNMCSASVMRIEGKKVTLVADLTTFTAGPSGV